MKLKYFSFIAVFCLFTACFGQTTQGEHLLKASEFEHALQDNKGLLLDVRTAAEFEEGHIKDAVQMDVTQADFDAKLQSIDKEQPIYVYCKSGGRSAKAVAKLKEQGFLKVYELDGGITAWKKSNYPTL